MGQLEHQLQWIEMHQMRKIQKFIMILDTSCSRPSTHGVSAVTEHLSLSWNLPKGSHSTGFSVLPGLLLNGSFPITLFKVTYSHAHPTCRQPSLHLLSPSNYNRQSTKCMSKMSSSHLPTKRVGISLFLSLLFFVIFPDPEIFRNI